MRALIGFIARCVIQGAGACTGGKMVVRAVKGPAYSAEQSAGVVEEHAKPPAAPKPTPRPLPQPFDLLDLDKGLRPLSAKAKQSESEPPAP